MKKEVSPLEALPSLGILTNTQLSDVHANLHLKLGERCLWLERLRPQITQAKHELLPTTSLTVLLRRQRKWRKDKKEIIAAINFVEDEMERRTYQN